MNKPTRKDYMEGMCSHQEYYRALAETAGVSYKNADPMFLEQVKRALENGDEHLNTIPLRVWDVRAAGLLPHALRAFKKHGDGPSLAGQVCLIKQAARDAVRT